MNATLAWAFMVAIDVTDLPYVHQPSFAFADPCATPQGYLVICCPKPCPITDTIKLPADITQLATEVQKLTSLLQEATAWMKTLQSIGSEISQLMSLFNSLTNISGMLKGITNPAAVTLPQTMAGVVKTDITSIKNGLTSLFTLPQAGASTQTVLDRLALVKDSSLTAAATGMNGRAAVQNNMNDLNSLATQIAAATTTRQDLAAKNAITIGLLKSLNTLTETISTLSQVTGVQALQTMGADSSQAASTTPKLSASPFFSTPPSTPVPPAPTSELPATTAAMGSGVIATQKALDLHNALAAAQEMQSAILQSQQIIGTYTTMTATAQTLANQLATDLVPYYANPGAVAAAIINSASPNITAPWPDSQNRTMQEFSATRTIANKALVRPSSLGTYICVPPNINAHGEPDSNVDCQTGAAAVIQADLYPVLDADNQATWYQQFTYDTPMCFGTSAPIADTTQQNLSYPLISQPITGSVTGQNYGSYGTLTCAPTQQSNLPQTLQISSDANNITLSVNGGSLSGAQSQIVVLQNEITTLSANVGIDVTNIAAVNAAISGYVATANSQFSTALGDANISPTTAATIQNYQGGITSMNIDPGAALYLNYDNSQPPVPTSAQIQTESP